MERAARGFHDETFAARKSESPNTNNVYSSTDFCYLSELCVSSLCNTQMSDYFVLFVFVRTDALC